MLNKNRQKGFTIIEVLVVVAIIGILASMVLVGLGGARMQGRDTRRITDLSRIQSALEMHFTKNGRYPTALSELVASGGVVRTLPRDPNPAWGYGYCVRTADRAAYILAAYLESADNPALREHDTDISTGICSVIVPGAPAEGCSTSRSPSRTYCTAL